MRGSSSVCMCVCVHNTECVHVIVQGFSYRFELCVCVYNRECLASVISFIFQTHSHMYFITVLVPFSQETRVIMDCISQVTAQHEHQLVQLPFLHTSTYGCMLLSLDGLATSSFITYLFGNT